MGVEARGDPAILARAREMPPPGASAPLVPAGYGA
jgi:hypothetical protein